MTTSEYQDEGLRLERMKVLVGQLRKFSILVESGVKVENFSNR